MKTKIMKSLAIASMALMACACNMEEPDAHKSAPVDNPSSYRKQAPKELTVAQSPLRLTPDMVGPETYVPIDLTLSPKLQSAEANFAELDIIEWIAEAAVKAAATKSTGYIFDMLVKSEESKQLDNLTAMTTEINAKLDELIHIVKMQNYEKYINERLTFVGDLYEHNKLYLDELSRTDSTDIDRITQLVQEWGDQTCHDNKSAENTRNFIRTITQTTIEQATYYDAYDAYVFNALPWERMGYDFREALRDGDKATMAATAKLSILYYLTNPTLSDIGKENAIKDINTAVEQFRAYAEAHAVVRHSDAICQINNCHIVMPAALYARDYQHQTWIATGTDTKYYDNFANDMTYGHATKSQADFRNGLLTVNETCALCSYYYTKDSGTSMMNHLKQDAGITTYTSYDPDLAFLLINSEANCSRSGNEYMIMVPAIPLAGNAPGVAVIGTAEFRSGGWAAQYMYFHGWASNSFYGQTTFNTLISQRY